MTDVPPDITVSALVNSGLSLFDKDCPSHVDKSLLSSTAGAVKWRINFYHQKILFLFDAIGRNYLYRLTILVSMKS